MALVDHAIQFGPEPPGHQLETEFKRRGDPALRVEAHSAQPAGFHVRDHCPADAGPVGEILLAPSPAMAQSTYKPAELGVVHGATMNRPVSSRCIGRLSAGWSRTSYGCLHQTRYGQLVGPCRHGR